jgi:hypothetical protein
MAKFYWGMKEVAMEKNASRGLSGVFGGRDEADGVPVSPLYAIYWWVRDLGHNILRFCP